MKIKSCKTRGEWTELRFMQRAIEQGLCFSKPWGEIKGYDFAVERGGKFVRVQVKSTLCAKPEGGYSCTLKDSKGKYRGNPFDFLAAYVIPDDAWFIIPGRKVRHLSCIALYPHSQSAKYSRYQEAWRLLRGDDPQSIRIDRIMACIDEDYPETGLESPAPPCSVIPEPAERMRNGSSPMQRQDEITSG